MKKVLQNIIYSGAILSLGLPIVSLAVGGLGSGTSPAVPGIEGKGIGEVYTTLNNIANIFLGILIAVAVIFIIYGSFLFLTSSGDDTKTKEARKLILYALVAVAVGLLAKGLVAAIQGIVPGL
ncbi:MAG: hypothetical protein AAB494_02275 [Patescibacteria group bacterium]